MNPASGSKHVDNPVLIDTARLSSITDVHRDETWNAGRLRAETTRIARALAERGVGPGDTIVIFHGGTPAFFSELLATWSAGACAVCANPSLTPGELEHIVEFVQPVLVTVRDDEHRHGSIAGVDVVDFSTETPTMDDDAPGRVISLPADAPALILFTSGTTGDPKGVVHTGSSLAARLRLNREAMGDDVLSASLCVLPTHFGHGLIGNCLTPLSAGGSLFLFPNPGMPGCARLAAVLAEHAVTFMSSVPSLWKVVTRLCPARPLPSLSRVHVGSAPLSATQWREIRAWCGDHVDVWNLYGLTETANWTAGACPGDAELADGLVGKMWGGRAGVRADDGSVTTNGTGEIVLNTPSCMSGYYRRPDLTEAAIENGWYRTGDYGQVDADGTIRLLGRLKTEINRAGMKILPEEIDLLLERHDDVEEACTFGVPDEFHGECVAVAVRLRENAVANEAALRDWCLSRIRRDCVPERWYVVDEIPKTDRGKINRDNVRRACTGI